MTFIERLNKTKVLAKTLDVSDSEPEVLDYEVVEETPGNPGDFYQEAEAPSVTFKIKKLSLPLGVGDDSYDLELKELKAGDKIKLNFVWEADYDISDLGYVHVEVKEDAVVKSVKVNDKDVEISTALMVGVDGIKRQSFSGRG